MPHPDDPLLSIPERGVPLEELAGRANAILESVGVHVADGRAATHIDGRTIRFYQTIGVLPKPEYEGRRALYHLTHLLRLVAAKRLQSEGHSLAQIQATLPTRTDAQLLRALRALGEPGDQAAAKASRPALGTTPAPSTHPARDTRNSARTHAPAPAAALRAFTISEGVTVLIDPRTVADPAALAATIAAALDPRAAGRRAPSTTTSGGTQ